MFRPMGMSMPPQAAGGLQRAQMGGQPPAMPPQAVGEPRRPMGAVQTMVPQTAPTSPPTAPTVNQAAAGPSPQALAAALGAAQTPQGVSATPGAHLSGVGMLGDLAKSAGAAHRQAKPELYNSNGAFNWERAFSNPWAAEVIRG